MAHTDRFPDAALRDVEKLFATDPEEHIAERILRYVWEVTPAKARRRFLREMLTLAQKRAVALGLEEA